MTTRKEKKDKKALLALLLLLIAIAIIIGVALAFFSDSITLPFEGTACTVRISAELNETTSLQYYTAAGSFKSQALTPNNLNPGDYIVFDYDVLNTGTKSAYVRAIISGIEVELIDNGWQSTNATKTIYVEAEDGDYEWDGSEFVPAAGGVGTGTHNPATVDSEDYLVPVPSNKNDLFKLYAIDLEGLDTSSFADIDELMEAYMTGNPAEKLEATGLITLATNSDAVVLYGSAETTDSSINSVSLAYVLWFDPAANNIYQGAKVTVSMAVQALQYRNAPISTDTSAWDAAWLTVHEAVYTTTP